MLWDYLVLKSNALVAESSNLYKELMEIKRKIS